MFRFPCDSFKLSTCTFFCNLYFLLFELVVINLVTFCLLYMHYILDIVSGYFCYISDPQGTERVFKKCVNTSQNALRLVDKDGVPLRLPNTATFNRLHSTYVLSPRGVPTRKSSTNHAYSGQLAQSKMKNMVNNLLKSFFIK